MSGVEGWFVYGGMALCLFAFWAIARHDWRRLTRPSRRVVATVVGHRIVRDGDGTHYAAIYKFHSESGAHEVSDMVLSASAHPPLGVLRELSYPAGRPELARPPRPLMWLAVYALLIGLLTLLSAKAAGVLPD